MQPSPPISTDVVLIGGGHTHAILLRQLGMVQLPGVRITLITDLVDTPYSGMLPCHISGLYDFDTAHIDLRPLTRFAHGRLLVDRVTGLDLEGQRVICANHPAVAFDVLSIDVGSTPATVAVPGAAAYGIPAKPVPQLLQRWDEILAAVRDQPQRDVTIGIVGGGVGGVELTLNMQERLERLLTGLPERGKASFHLFHRGADLAADRNRWTRHRLKAIFQQRRIGLHLPQTVTALTRDEATGTVTVHCQSGLSQPCDYVIWVTSAAAPKWLQKTGLSLTEDGFIQVQDTLQTCSHPHIFAAGDVATMVNHPRPKAGVFAVRQAQPLYQNLLRYLQGRALKPFQPQKKYLNIIDVGYGRAIASRGPFAFESTLARWWKDRIDRKFMAQFETFPAMAEKTRPPLTLAAAAGRPPAAAMICRGCGSKVGQEALQQAIAQVRQQYPDAIQNAAAVLVGLDAPDDAAVVQVPAGLAVVHTVDWFRALVDDPFIFAQIALKHCLGDIYAMGASPSTVLALVDMPNATPPKQVDTLYPLLAGIQQGLRGTGAALVGGHTTLGTELALGFACNGVVDPGQLWQKAGMVAGDGLILTQPLGTGTLFAADQQGRAKGRWIEAAIQHMLQPHRAAAEILRAHQVRACTDITGFGLIGHLLEMVEASGVNAVLDLTALPVLVGARQTLAAGIVSSLQPQNQQATRAIAWGPTQGDHPDYPLLFDPQTAGGLLAAVPAPAVTACWLALREAGYGAATLIGTVTPLENSAQPIKIGRW